MGYRRFQMSRIDERASDTCDSRDSSSPVSPLPSQKSQVSQRGSAARAINDGFTVAAFATVASPLADRTIAITSADWLDHYEERAAIREFDGGLPQPEAERLAQADTVTALGPRPTQTDGRRP